jgi:hypothetical protein
MRSKITLRKTRTVHVVIAAIMLAVPASAFALSSAASDNPAAASPAPLQANVTPRQLSVNHNVTLSGRAPVNYAGQRALVQTATSRQGAWQTLTSSQIGSQGQFRMRTRLRHSGFLRVVAATGQGRAADTRAATGSGTSAPAVSQPVPVLVHAAFKLAARTINVLGSHPVTVHGHLTPARAGRSVRLQVHGSRGWRTISRTRTGGAGGFRLHGEVGSGLKRRLRVVFGGDNTNGATTRPAGTVTVYSQDEASWYSDGGSTACGFHATMGVANRTLPCGTKVRFYSDGHTVTATVDDRGPYVGGRNWDLNQNTASALGFGGVGTVWVTQ